jgi:hypothetical protein
MSGSGCAFLSLKDVEWCSRKTPRRGLKTDFRYFLGIHMMVEARKGLLYLLLIDKIS